MKKRFIAFYDALCFSIIAGIMWTTAIVIFITGHMTTGTKFWVVARSIRSCMEVVT